MGISVAHPQSGYSFTASKLNWNLEMLVFVEAGIPEYPEKNPQSRDENQQQTKPMAMCHPCPLKMLAKC